MILSISNKSTIQKMAAALFHPKPMMILLAVINNKFHAVVYYLSVKTATGPSGRLPIAGNWRLVCPVVSGFRNLLNFYVGVKT